MNYLIEEKVDFRNKRVLDLGCGVGILGIYALTRGATVDFQDYVRTHKFPWLEFSSHTRLCQMSALQSYKCAYA